VSNKLPLVEQLKILEQVQEYDSKIRNLENEKNSFPEELGSLQSEVKKLETQFQELDAQAEIIRKNLGQINAALELNEDRSARANSKLEGVTSGPEFTAATKEIEQLKKMNDDFSAKKLTIVSQLEKIDAELSEIKSKLDEGIASKESRENSIQELVAEIEGKISSIETEKKQYTVQIEAQVLSRYNRIQKARDSALAPAVAGRCGACNMMLPPQMFNVIVKCETLHQCPSCQRIFFVPAAKSDSE